MSAPGMLAGYADAAALQQAARTLRGHGRRCELYAPHALEMEAAPSPLPRWSLLGAVLGGGGTYLLQWYTAVIAYPLNIGGRPDASWPSFVPAAAEMTLLGAAVFGFAAFLIGAGLPRLRHPLFEAELWHGRDEARYLLWLPPQRDDGLLRELLATAPCAVERRQG